MRGWCVTNASPSGLRSCMEDEGRPFEVDFREQASNHPKRHRSKAVVVSVGGKGRRYRSGVDHGDERERTTDDVSKHFLATSKPGAGPSPVLGSFVWMTLACAIPAFLRQACPSTRQRRRSNPARPYISRLMTLSRLTWPSTWPLLHGSVSAARTASSSRRRRTAPGRWPPPRAASRRVQPGP